jgi:hypothetical protein
LASLLLAVLVLDQGNACPQVGVADSKWQFTLEQLDSVGVEDWTNFTPLLYLAAVPILDL